MHVDQWSTWKESLPPTNLLVRCGRFSGHTVGFTPFVPTHPHDEGVVKETQGFIGARELLSKGTESERNFGWEILVVGAKVG